MIWKIVNRKKWRRLVCYGTRRKIKWKMNNYDFLLLSVYVNGRTWGSTYHHRAPTYWKILVLKKEWKSWYSMPIATRLFGLCYGKTISVSLYHSVLSSVLMVANPLFAAAHIPCLTQFARMNKQYVCVWKKEEMQTVYSKQKKKGENMHIWIEQRERPSWCESPKKRKMN